MSTVFNLQRLIVIGVVVFLLTTVESVARDNWEVITEMPTQREHFATAVVDGNIYLIGGTLLENQRGPYGISTVEVYDPKTDNWQRLADMPTPRARLGTAVVDGKIYALGGYSGIDNRGVNIKILPVVEVYDPHTDTWERKQDMPTPRREFGTEVIDRKIYAIGGANYFEKPWRLDRVEMYDPDIDTWAKRANMPTRRSGLRTAVVNDRIYAIGGYGWPQVGNRGGPFLTNIEVYHPTTNRWQKKSGMPNPRVNFSTVVIADEIYLIGGFVWQDELFKFLATVDVYHPQTKKWKDGPPLPTPIIPLGAAAVNGRIYVFGGIVENWELITSVMVFDTGFRAVTPIDKLSTRWAELKTSRQN